MCSEYTQDSLDLLSSFSTIPMVVMDWGPNANTDVIDDHSFDGGYLATKHLIECGHKKSGLSAANSIKLPQERVMKALKKQWKKLN